jgi:cysteine synthase B
MIIAAEQAGRLQPGRTIRDATSGNTGIGYAMIGAARGYPVHLILPGNVSAERLRILRAYGAQLTLTDASLGVDGAIEAAQFLFEADPDRYSYLNQYDNDDNWRAHYDGTAWEIWNQTAGCVTHFVAALGTSGSFMGTARRLRELNPRIECASVQPDAPFHGLEGMKHMPSARVPAIYDATLADRNIEIHTETAYRAVKRLIREEGMLASVGRGGGGVPEIARSIPGIARP